MLLSCYLLSYMGLVFGWTCCLSLFFICVECWLRPAVLSLLFTSRCHYLCRCIRPVNPVKYCCMYFFQHLPVTWQQARQSCLLLATSSENWFWISWRKTILIVDDYSYFGHLDRSVICQLSAVAIYPHWRKAECLFIYLSVCLFAKLPTEATNGVIVIMMHASVIVLLLRDVSNNAFWWSFATLLSAMSLGTLLLLQLFCRGEWALSAWVVLCQGVEEQLWGNRMSVLH